MNLKILAIAVLSFSLCLSPSVLATYYCAGTSLCIQFNQTYVDPGSPGTGYNTAYYIITTNSSDSEPDYFIMSRVYSSGDCEAYEYNSSWDYIGTITYDPCSSITEGVAWTNVSGTERLIGVHQGVGTDYAYSYNMTGGDKVTTNSVSAGSFFCDWYNDLFYCGRGNSLYSWNIYDNNFSYVESLTAPFMTYSKPHISRTNPNNLYGLDSANSRLYVEDLTTETSLGYLDIEATFGIDLNPLGSASGYIASVLANAQDTKLWIAYRNNTGTAHMSVAEFDINATHTYSNVGLTHPTDGESYDYNNIVMYVALYSAYNGTLSCYINGSLIYNNSFPQGTLDTIEFPSGELNNSVYNWTCEFQDIYGYVYNSGTNEFYINVLGTTGEGLIADVGDGIAELLGFETDALGTANEKGIAFLGIIIALAVAVGVGVYIQDQKKGGSPQIVAIVLIAMILLETMIGWIPIWITILFTILAGFILIIMFQKGF